MRSDRGGGRLPAVYTVSKFNARKRGQERCTHLGTPEINRCPVATEPDAVPRPLPSTRLLVEPSCQVIQQSAETASGNPDADANREVAVIGNR